MPQHYYQLVADSLHKQPHNPPPPPHLTHLQHGDQLLPADADPVPVSRVNDVDDGVGVAVVASPIGPMWGGTRTPRGAQ